MNGLAMDQRVFTRNRLGSRRPDGLLVIMLAAGLVSAPAGCRREAISTEVQQVSSEMAATPVETLRARAKLLWDAKVAEDCATVFLFEPLRGQEGVTEEDFCVYFKTEEPFKVQSCTVGEALVEGEMGWVELDVTTSMRRFPSAAPVSTHRWERWHLVNDEWRPVPANLLDSYPAAPPERDLAAEADLRARFEESWQARVDRDWPRLFDFIDPRDREQIDLTVFSDSHELIEYISCNVHWVEVIGDSGIVRATVHHKINDPSLTKMDARDAAIREEWIRFEGEWYLDTKRPA